LDFHFASQVADIMRTFIVTERNSGTIVTDVDVEIDVSGVPREPAIPKLTEV